MDLIPRYFRHCIWNVKWIRCCKEQAILLYVSKDGRLQKLTSCLLSLQMSTSAKPQTNSIIFPLQHDVQGKPSRSLSVFSSPAHFGPSRSVTPADPTRCQPRRAQTAAELPRELTGVTISLGLSIALVLNEVSICQCLGYMYRGLQLVGIREIQNSLC